MTALQRGTLRISTQPTAGANTYATTSARMNGKRISRAATRTMKTSTAHTERKTTPARFFGRWMMISVILRSSSSRGLAPPPGDVGEERVEVAERRGEVLRHHANVRHDRHEVRVPFPARHDVHVQVLS